MLDREVKPSWNRKTDGSYIVVTDRLYKDVRDGLRLPDNYFRGANGVVLSVGEGLSDFAKVLQSKNKHIEVFAVDPIYELGGSLFDKTKRKENALNQAYGEYVNSLLVGDSTLPDPHRVAANSVYKLCFPDKTFTNILSHRAFEHIDFSRALPELLRVLKPGGEIRMGGLSLYYDMDSELLDTHYLEMFNSCEGQWRIHPGLSNSLDILTSNKQLTTYVLVDSYPKYKVREHYPQIGTGSLLIIRNDRQVPMLSELKDDKKHPNILVKVGDKNSETLYKTEIIKNKRKS